MRQNISLFFPWPGHAENGRTCSERMMEAGWKLGKIPPWNPKNLLQE